ncbi:uncharacterized protein B0P05DRAFT_589013 [Gilbertella persicaria]|uniref:uncharacterized protein n=1 Tax=Gilbertella persicaria TaxID=101096 RepID=UPI00221FC93C|nr:uncharacterized protein B0P05DRAFT_589013 [Gilbertella persicaria]KAI8071158.1 hypothetical protein B0P05DRAFT_589013 [Gilbertella persicaria]
MKPICNYCHIDDHIRANCPILDSRKKSCYQCGSMENLRAELESHQARPTTVCLHDFMSDIEEKAAALTEAQPTLILIHSEAEREVLEQDEQNQSMDEDMQENADNADSDEAEEFILDELMQGIEKEGYRIDQTNIDEGDSRYN